MMKKLLLTAFSGIMAVAAIGQVCTPDLSYVPTSTTGAGIQDLPCAVVNVPYNASSTIVIPTEVAYEIQPGQPIDVTVCQVRVDSITNFPQSSSLNYTIYYEGASVGLGTWIVLDDTQPVDRACVSVNGTFTAEYHDSLLAHGQVKISVTGNCNQTLTVSFTALTPDGEPLKVGVDVYPTPAGCGIGIEETMSNNSFDVAQNYPNPFNGDSQIAFSLPEAGNVTFRVTNLVGKTVKEVNTNGNAGINYLNISSADYAAGVYMYSVSFGGRTVTKRMIIK